MNIVGGTSLPWYLNHQKLFHKHRYVSRQPSRRPAPVSFARPTPASRVTTPPAAPKAAPGRTNGSTARFSAATVSRAVPRVHLSASPPAAAVDTEAMYDYGAA